MSEQFAAGDLVAVKALRNSSRRPHMVVEVIRRDGLISTFWYDTRMRVCRDSFDSFVLEKVEQ